MNIIIGADIVPRESNYDEFNSGSGEALVGAELNRIISEASYRIYNLECPLTDSNDKIAKYGPWLKAPATTVNGIKALGADMLTLANNHIMDYSTEGFSSTVETLREANIAFVGAGSNPEEAAEPKYFGFGDKMVGVYACAEHEFSIVGDNVPGANPFDPLESLDHIGKMKEKCDFAIVLYHGGKEYYRYPSPRIRKVCRKMIEKGADLVVCQHSHCIGCMEEYKGGTAVYGQGNFLFEYRNSSNEFVKTGILISIDEQLQISYIPFERFNHGVKLSYDETILEDFHKRSEEIKQVGFVEKTFDEYADSTINDYLVMLLKENSISLKAARKAFGSEAIGNMVKNHIKKERMAAIDDIIKNESHRELLLCGLNRSEKHK